MMTASFENVMINVAIIRTAFILQDIKLVPPGSLRRRNVGTLFGRKDNL